MPETKPHLTIATLGLSGAGKTTLTAAITQVLAKQGLAEAKSYETLSKPIQVNEDGVITKRTQVVYETTKYRFTHIDCEFRQAERLMQTSAVNIDCIILVVSAEDSLYSSISGQLWAARNVQNLVVFLNKTDLCEDDWERLELVEMEIPEWLSRYGIYTDDYPFIQGSAAKALKGDARAVEQIKDLLNACDRFNEPPTYSRRECTKFECLVYFLSTKEGGRTVPVSGKVYRPSYFFGTTEKRGLCEVISENSNGSIFPDIEVDMRVLLESATEVVEFQRFTVREGSKIVGVGRITKIIA
jgi:translation elongation factor EF-Tu-like GTPase